MIKYTLVVIVTILIATRYSAGQGAMDAEEALNHLRLVTSQRLNAAFLEHIRLSRWIDTTAFDTKDPRKEPDSDPDQDQRRRPALRAAPSAADDLESCVNKLAVDTLDAIAKRSSLLAVALLKDIYDEEKALIFCGRTDEDCLDEVASDIRKKARRVRELIEEELDIDREDVLMQVEAIHACASNEEQ